VKTTFILWFATSGWHVNWGWCIHLWIISA